MQNLKYNELIIVNNLIGKCNNDKDLENISVTLNIIKLSREIKSIIKEYNIQQEELLTKLNVEKKVINDKEVFDWNEKSLSEKEQIQKALTLLNNVDHDLPLLNQISENDFVILTRGLLQNEVAFLYDYLVKE